MYGIKLEWSNGTSVIVNSTNKFIEEIHRHGIPNSCVSFTEQPFNLISFLRA